MSRVLVSFCLLGAGLATANTLLLQRSSCPSVVSQTSAPNSVVSVAPSQAKSSPPKDKLNTQKAADMAHNASQEITGSLRKVEKSVPGVGVGKVEVDQSKNQNGSGQWAEVTVASTVHSAPSYSARFIAYQAVGTPLRVIKRAGGWTQVVDPVDSQIGWIYGKHLRLSEGPPAHARPKTWSQPRKRGWRRYSPRFTVGFGVYPIW
jgi:hypothetical protein